MFQFLSVLGNKTVYYAIAAILAIVLIFFIFYGDTLLSSLGFQTKSNLKAEVARLQEENKQYQAQIEVLHEAMKKKDAYNQAKMEAISAHCDEQEKIQKKAQQYKKNLETLRQSRPNTITSDTSQTSQTSQPQPENTAVIFNVKAAYKEIFIGETP